MRTTLMVEFVILAMTTCNILCHSIAFGTNKLAPDSAINTEEFCMLESFQPQCKQNEAILMSSATYGRMRIGRCITAEEVAKFGNEPPYFDCSTNVLPILDDKCSGKAECLIRQIDISNELSTKPCFPGLNVYLEVSYECVIVADEDRSCTLIVSNIPSHIIPFTDSQRKCATESRPWIIEAPMGQKIKITLIDFLAGRNSRKSCPGVVMDKAANRNVSICIGGEQRTRFSYSSKAESLEIYYSIEKQEEESGDIRQFALKFEAVGCSDLIAPEDAWLKRNDDSIVIGCYSNRLSWELHCDGERWIGVFGNCSQKDPGLFVEELNVKEIKWADKQILTVVAVGGLTVTICLAVLCAGILCLRRLSKKTVKREEYKVLDFQFNSSTNGCKRGTESMQSTALPSAAIDDSIHSNRTASQQMAPTYSVFVGEGNFNDNQTSFT